MVLSGVRMPALKVNYLFIFFIALGLIILGVQSAAEHGMFEGMLACSHFSCLENVF